MRTYTDTETIFAYIEDDRVKFYFLVNWISTRLVAKYKYISLAERKFLAFSSELQKYFFIEERGNFNSYVG